MDLVDLCAQHLLITQRDFIDMDISTVLPGGVKRGGSNLIAPGHSAEGDSRA